MEDIESKLKEVYEFCNQSPKQRCEFGVIAKVLAEDLSYFSGVKNVRCVASRYRAMGYDSYPHTPQGDTWPSQVREIWKITALVKKFSDPGFLRYMFSLEDLMTIVSPLSCRLQSDDMMVNDTQEELYQTVIQLIALKTTRGKIEAQFDKKYSQENDPFCQWRQVNRTETTTLVLTRDGCFEKGAHPKMCRLPRG